MSHKEAALPKAEADGLSLLLQILGLSSKESSIDRDVVLVGIDFENTQYFYESKSKADEEVTSCAQVGIAVLDTRHFNAADPSLPVITTYNFVAGTKEYYHKAKHNFQFGQPELIHPGEFVHSINACIPKERSVFLVGHGVEPELNNLSELRFDFRDAGVVGCLDTLRIAAQVLPHISIRLGKLLGVLGCPHDFMHNGGNDANFTLRAALLLACRSCKTISAEEEPLRSLDGRRLEAIEHIAKAGIASHELGCEEELSAKKAAREEKRRVKAHRRWSKFRSPAQQEQIRQLRAEAKLAKETEEEPFLWEDCGTWKLRSRFTEQRTE